MVITKIHNDLLFFTASSTLSDTKGLEKIYGKASYCTQTSRIILGKTYKIVTLLLSRTIPALHLIFQINKFLTRFLHKVSLPMHHTFTVHTRISCKLCYAERVSFLRLTEKYYRAWLPVIQKGTIDGSYSSVPAHGESKGFALSELMHESHTKRSRAGAGLLEHMHFLPPHLSPWSISVTDRKTTFQVFLKHHLKPLTLANVLYPSRMGLYPVHRHKFPALPEQKDKDLVSFG